MKKAFLAIAAVALLFATSCKKESINPAIDVPEGSFLATIDNGANPQNAPVVKDGMTTKTTIDANRYVIWEEGDQISINGSAYTTDKSGNTVVFKNGNATGTTFHAFYPASIAGTDNAGTLPATQTIETGKVSNLPMYATSTDNQLTFHNICAVLKIVIPSFVNGATRIEVSTDKAMNGAFTVTSNAAVMSKTTDLTDDDKKVTISKATGAFATGEVVYIAVPANTYSNLKVEFFNNTTSMWNKTLATCTLDVNKVYNINATQIPSDCFCFTAGADNVTISLSRPNSQILGTVYLEYCTKTTTGTCTAWTEFTSGTSVTLANAGDKVYFRGGDGTTDRPANTAFSDWNGKHHTFQSTGNVEVSGNIMYLLNGTTPPTSFTNADNTYVFYCLFSGMTGLTSAQNLLLPVQTLTAYCYRQLFEGCTTLTTAPDLPATTLNDFCYYQMFANCTTLTTAPDLPATTLAESCYSLMFYDCTSLTTAPVLRAGTLASDCYLEMFYGCSRLGSVTMLATSEDWDTDFECLQNWLNYAGSQSTSRTLYVKDNATKTFFESHDAQNYDVRPSNWTVAVYSAPSPIRRK